jgi:hypothetical protein
MADIDPTKVKQQRPEPPDPLADLKPHMVHPFPAKKLRLIDLVPDLRPQGLSKLEQGLVIDEQWLERLRQEVRSSAPESRASSSPVTNKY